MKTAKEIREESRALFLERFDGKPKLKLLYYHTFLCPVAMAEAMVKEHIIEDYDVLELLVLRLYEAGFHSVSEIASLSGMQEVMIERALNNEINVYHHISEDSGEITEMGRKTLDENADGRLHSHIMYDTPRRLQIEAATGTVIPAYLEENNIKYLKSFLEEKADGIVPRESVKYDEELREEINARLLEYKHMDILNEGDTIVSIESLHTTQIYYRWAYLAKFEGMKYPMIVIMGKRSVSNVNAESIKKGNFSRKTAVSLAISVTDDKYLRENGMGFDDVLVRNDAAFEYLERKTAGFKFHTEQNDIEFENKQAVFEEEKIMETEGAAEDE